MSAMPKNLEYGANSILPTTESLLKQNGAIQRLSEPLAAVLQCATCPLAKGNFYNARAEECTGMRHVTALRSTQRLNRADVFRNPRRDDITYPGGYIGKVTVYDVAPQVRESIPNPQALPGCVYKD